MINISAGIEMGEIVPIGWVQKFEYRFNMAPTKPALIKITGKKIRYSS